MDDTNRSATQDSAEIEIRVPALPESVSDATLVAWHKKPGEAVRRDENLVDIETDKVVFEIPAPADGILQEIRKQGGDTVTSKELIAVIAPRGGAATAVPPKAPAAVAGATTGAARRDAEETVTPASPAVRRLLEEHQLDPHPITGSGKNGRLTKTDVLRHLQAPEADMADEPAAARTEAAVETAHVTEEEPGVRRVPMSRLRERIAERMVEAQQTAAILTTFNEINMQAVLDLRRRHKERFEQRHGVKLGLMSFFVAASVAALKRFPIINASVEGNEILYREHYDISMAVSSPRGLVVPVLRDTDRLSFAEIEAAIADFAQRARDASLTIEELSGGTFTITNGGVFGSLLSTPILNPPQSAILGMHKMEDRPIAENGEVRIRPMMYVALSYDHRIIDGRDAVQFLVMIKELLEDPARLLLEV